MCCGKAEVEAVKIEEIASPSQHRAGRLTDDVLPRDSEIRTQDSLPLSLRISMPLPSVPEARPALNLTMVIALIQELTSLSSSKNKFIIPKSMALLCTKLDVTWACLTAFSSTGQHYQHCGAAHVMRQETLLQSHPDFVSALDKVCREGPEGDTGSEDRSTPGWRGGPMSHPSSRPQSSDMASRDVSHHGPMLLPHQV